MKPTIEQVVEHFGLPEEALDSMEVKHCISIIGRDELVVNRESGGDDMGYVAWAFACEWDRGIHDWFKPNYGMGDPIEMDSDD